MNQPKASAGRAGQSGRGGQAGNPAQAGRGGQPGKAAQGSRGRQPGKAVQGSRAGQAAPELLVPPRTVALAVRLMYAGAVLTAVGLIADALYIVINHSVRLSHPHATAAQVNATQSALLIALVFSGLLEIGAWIFMARANRGGLRWARIAASVLFAIYTLYTVNIMLSGGAIVDLVLTFLVWLAGLGATAFLWRKESSDYFNAPTVS